MRRDFELYYLRVGHRWTRIDYDKPAEHWMERKACEPGKLCSDPGRAVA